MAPDSSQLGASALRALATFAVFAFLASSVATFATSASATTAPGSLYALHLDITDSQVVIIPHRGSRKYVSTNGHSARFPRGVLIQFDFLNRGSKTYIPAIRFTNYAQENPYGPKQTFATGDPVAPGRHGSLFGNFYFRGAFVIEELFHKKPVGKPVSVTIY